MDPVATMRRSIYTNIHVCLFLVNESLYHATADIPKTIPFSKPSVSFAAFIIYNPLIYLCSHWKANQFLWLRVDL